MDYKGKLLIVEDEKITRENLEYVMQKEGYEVESTNNGSDAIKKLQEQMFDLVLTDLRMGKVDGTQVLSTCKELYPDSEVIIITAFASLPSAVDTMKKAPIHTLQSHLNWMKSGKLLKKPLKKCI